tara:strand:- start:732 stop:1445 length:714 start_codon:yes stop_codon:yes gene_type:complete
MTYQRQLLIRISNSFKACITAYIILLALTVTTGLAEKNSPVVYKTDFENGATEWSPTDAAAWKLRKTEKGLVYSQFIKRSKYEPPHRSPYNISLLKSPIVGSFQLDVDVLSTHEDYGHRDCCLFFGYQNPSNFYYVHLGKKTDDHANQIFIVNDAPRTKISTKTTSGTNWDSKWHHVRIIRNAETGKIQVYFDDMESPIMEAVNKAFTHGKIGLGSFDDTGDWDNLILRGELYDARD